MLLGISKKEISKIEIFNLRFANFDFHFENFVFCFENFDCRFDNCNFRFDLLLSFFRVQFSTIFIFGLTILLSAQNRYPKLSN
jgi:hypothetical protein